MKDANKSHQANRQRSRPDRSMDNPKASARQEAPDEQSTSSTWSDAQQSQPQSGFQATAGGKTLRSHTIGALPIVNGIIGRLRLPQLLKQHLPKDPPQTLVPTHRALLVLLRNILFSREPIYGIGEWAQRYAPDLLDLWISQVDFLNDDRLGRCLDRLFVHAGPELVLHVTQQAIEEFQLSLDELHNDSTTITFHGAYSDAEQEGRMQGRATPAITWGHNKDHRPDLKQLLFILTVTNDGGVPIYFQSTSGNVADDQTHQDTWNLLRELVGRIQALLMIYYLALLVQTLLERELRQAMQVADKKSIRLYPERRKCSRPTTRRLLDVFEPIQRHTLINRTGREETYVTELSLLQLEILELLGINANTYGH